MIKKWIVIFLLISYPTFVGSSNLPEEVALKPHKPKPEVIPVDSLQGYYDKLAMLESSNNYSAINQFNYLGKYQFSKRTLRGLQKKGELVITNEEIKNFIRLPEAQERAVRALTKHNLRILHRYGLKKYVGSRIKGVTITTEGMLAGAHLLGAKAVKQFIKSNGRIVKKDGNGTTILEYMVEFE